MLVYMVRVRGVWWLSREPIQVPDHESVGLEVLTCGTAQQRVAAIKKAAEATSPESLAVQADLVAVGSLERSGEHPFRVICRVERVVKGTSAREMEVVPRSFRTAERALGDASIVMTQRYARVTDEAVIREPARLAVGTMETQ